MKKFLIVLVFLFSNLMAQENNQTTFTLSPKGFITSWLIKGPFTASEGVLRDKDFLVSDGGETNKFSIDKTANEISLNRKTAESNKWFPVYSDKYIISFLDYFTFTNKTVGYGLCFIESEQDRKVIIKLGSDDGVKLFLNGSLIHNNGLYRGIIIDEDVVNAELNKGINPLLIKIDQGSGDWGFCLRMTGENDEQLKDVRVKIPYLFTREEILGSALSSLNVNTILDKTTQNTRLIVLVSAENSFPKNFDTFLKFKLILLNNSNDILEEFHNMDIESMNRFSEKEVSYIPKNLQPGQYVIRLIVLDKNNNELSTKENIVFWN